MMRSSRLLQRGRTEGSEKEILREYLVRQSVTHGGVEERGNALHGVLGIESEWWTFDVLACMRTSEQRVSKVNE